MHDNTPTSAQHDAADAAIVANMTRRILDNEWGRQIIDGAIDECYSAWALKFSTVRRDDGHVERVHVVTVDPDTGKPSGNHVLHDDDIANAIARIWNGNVECGYPRDYIRDAIYSHDAAYIDADASDAILQAAAYGEIIYG